MFASHWLVYFLKLNGLETVGNQRSSSLCISTLALRAAKIGIILSESLTCSNDMDNSSNIPYNFLCVGLDVPQVSKKNNWSESGNHENAGVIQDTLQSNAKVRKETVSRNHTGAQNVSVRWEIGQPLSSQWIAWDQGQPHYFFFW